MHMGAPVLSLALWAAGSLAIQAMLNCTALSLGMGQGVEAGGGGGSPESPGAVVAKAIGEQWLSGSSEVAN